MLQSLFRNYSFKNFNIKLVAAVIGLTCIGIAVIGSANSAYQSRQILGFMLGLVAMLIVSMIDYDFLLTFTPVYYVLTIVILASVFVIGNDNDSKGATRWIDLGFIRFQPSEFAKILLVLIMAKYLAEYYETINDPKRLAITGIICAVPLVLILREPDLSTTIVTFLMLATMIFYAGLSYKIVGTVLGIAIPALVILIVLLMQDGQTILKDYQGVRILAWLKPDEYPSSSYQQQNSIMAIGSGRLFGKGLYNNSVNSVKNGNYISESHTDFIFSVAGEELGFIGCAVIVILLLVIVLQCFKIAYNSKNLSGKLIAIGIGSMLGYQSFVNICVVTGLMPNTGLPLPFMSYGLTSLVSLYIGIGLVLNVGLQSGGRRRGGLKL